MNLCTCQELDDDLIEDGWTCYHCYDEHGSIQCDCEVNQ